jgi:tetratricopeptide (TPR) repeat protein
MKNSNPPSRSPQWRITLLALSILSIGSALACAGLGDGRRAPVTQKTPDGFTITDTARLRLGLRWEFEKAVEALQRGDHDLAIELLVPITESDPEFAAPHIDLAIAYRETGRYEAARAVLERALEVSPRHPAALNELGIVYRRLGRFDEARAAYESALELHPRFHFARKNLAIVCDLFLSDLECALENYGIYHEAVPEDEEVAIWSADLRNRSGN